MKALSINQPWAWCIVNGYKSVENRDWQTKRRGTILIHAGKKFDNDGYAFIKRQFPEILIPPKDEIERGGIVGQADIADCVSEMDDPWFFGKHGFILANQKPCELVICKGALGFFTPDYNSRYKEPAKKTTALNLFTEEQAPRQRIKRMHFTNVGMCPSGGYNCVADFECKRCGHKEDCVYKLSTKEVKRGLACPKCNEMKA